MASHIQDFLHCGKNNSKLYFHFSWCTGLILKLLPFCLTWALQSDHRIISLLKFKEKSKPEAGKYVDYYSR